MLAYSQFQALSGAQQQAYVTTWGTMLLTRTPGSFIVELYYLNDYYCELWRQLPTAAVAYLHSFTERADLHPYLSLISLPQNLIA